MTASTRSRHSSASCSHSACSRRLYGRPRSGNSVPQRSHAAIESSMSSDIPSSWEGACTPEIRDGVTRSSRELSSPYGASIHHVLSRGLARAAASVQERGRACHGTAHARTILRDARPGDELDRGNCQAHDRQYALAVEGLSDYRWRKT